MWLYGHQVDSDEDYPLRLKEVTVAADAGTLRRLARFLEFAAQQQDLRGERFGHEHFADYDAKAPKTPSFVVTGPVKPKRA